MSSSPARSLVLPELSTRTHTRHSGNLAQRISSPLGHFLFQSPENIGGSFPNTNEVELLPVCSAAWRTRRHNRPHPPAKSGTSPLIQVDNFAHSCFSVVDTAETNRSAFA